MAFASPRLVSVPVLLTVWLAACSDDNRPPALGLLGDREIQIGQSLVLPLIASDPDGDRLTFKVDGLPDTAQVSPRTSNEAVLVWSPLITDTQPGGRRYEVEITVEDGRGGRASQTFGVIAYPAFGIPSFVLPAGLVLNLATQDALELAVEVKDDDSLDITLEMTESPEGARFQTAERKLGFFYWKPDDDQRKVAVHRAIFRAIDDTNPPVLHVLTIVLLNAERQSGCEGTPPTVSHVALADQVASGPLRFTATATDTQSQVQAMTLFWNRGTPDDPMTAVAMSRVAQGSTEWVADVNIGAVPDGGALIHYHFIASDNDDPTGIACDLSARLPRVGVTTAAVYSASNPDTCVDDGDEPDGSTDLAPRLKAGLYPGRRLCGPDTDLVSVDAPANTTLTATVTFDATHGSPTLRLVDGSDTTLTTASISEGRLSLRYDVADDTPLFLEVAASSVRMSYTLELVVDETRCEDDAVEPDSTPDDSRSIPIGQSVSQRVCSGDSDYFALALSPGQAVRVALAFDHRYGDIDLELYGADGTTVLARSASERSLEEIVYRPTDAGIAFARVYGVAGASNDYTFSYEVSTSSTCPPDGLGQNGTPGEAAILFQGVYEGFNACPDAPDWFAVDLNDEETLEVLLLTDEGTATIELYRDPDGSPIAVGTPDIDGFSEVAVDGIGSPERLYFRVSATDTPPNPGGVPTVTYSLLQEVSDPPGACRPDRAEPNDIGSPVDLEAGVHTWLRHCGNGDTDVYRLTVPAFTTLVVITSHLANIGFSDLELRDPSGGLVADEVGLDEGAYLEMLLEAPGEYTLYLKPFEVGTTLAYDLAIFFD